MARSVQDFINQAGAAARRVEQLPPPRRQASSLILWAAFHLGSGHAAESTVNRLHDVAGWNALSEMLNVDAYDSLEATAFTLAVTSTTTALDLCASAAYRLAGGQPRPDRESDFGDWRDPKKTANLTPTPAVGRWVASVLRSPSWAELEAARHQMVHRTTPRKVSITVGSHRLPSSQYHVGQSTHSVDDAVRYFVAFGRRRFDTFCAAIKKDLP